jgi:hypothetical protein
MGAAADDSPATERNVNNAGIRDLNKEPRNVDTCTYHKRRKAIAALTNGVHLCRHCLRIGTVLLETCRNTNATACTIGVYLDDCAAYVRTQPR